MARTLVIKALDVAQGVFPKVDKYNIRLNKQGDGTSTITLNISTSAGPNTVTISGGKFIVAGNEVDSITVSTATQTFFVKLTSEQAYIYFPQTVNVEFRPTWDTLTKNSPQVDFKTFNRNFKTLVRQFENATLFNQDISNWDTSKVTDFTLLFANAISFNQNIEKWNTSQVTTFSNMFNNASMFNQPLENWDTSKVTVTAGMFNGASSFNQPLGKWDVTKVTSMALMFYRALSFNSSLVGWNTLSLTDTNGMFREASLFNQPLNHLNTSKVTNMLNMFRSAFAFNQPIGNWDVSKVTNMSFMFYDAKAFQQDLSSWNFNVNVDLSNFMTEPSYNPVYYTNLLVKLASIDWTVRATPKILNMGTIRYTSAGASARATLVSNGWTITDGGTA